MGKNHRAEPASNIENNVKSLRIAKGLSQSDLAASSQISRQAVCAIEADQYIPTTPVALRLAWVLGCRVEDLFNLRAIGEFINGELIGEYHHANESQLPMRVKIVRIEHRYVIRPIIALGELSSYIVPADGLLVSGKEPKMTRVRASQQVRVQLLRDRRLIDQEIAIAGCDPAIFLVGEYLRRYKETSTVVGWMMGSSAALESLKRREVHVAGLHIVDEKTGESNLPYLRKHLVGDNYLVVTFAVWEEGLILRRGNPKRIHKIESLSRRDVKFINREEGAGARNLLDQQLTRAGMQRTDINGYDFLADSHFTVARRIADGSVDAGVGVRSVASLFGLDFLPLRSSRYDLVIPKEYLTTHSSIAHLLEAIVSRQFRTEIEALGGYDTTETGIVRQLRRE